MSNGSEVEAEKMWHTHTLVWSVSLSTVLGAAAPAAAERVPGVSVHHGNAAQASGKSAVVPHHLQS